MRKVYLFLLLCAAVCAFSQSPDLINYQGVVRGATGVPMASRNIQVHFELRQGGSTSSPVYQENQALSTNLLGLFSTQIGQGNSTSFGQLDWQAGSMYLSVAIDTTGGTNFVELGVQQLVSVPYAMNARTVEKVSSSYSANVLTIAGQSYTLAQPSGYGAGAGISIAGTVISNSAPDQTVTIQPVGSNVQVTGAYPNFSVASTPSLNYNNNGQLSITDGNTVDITQSLTLQGNTLTVGPPSNTIALPVATTPSITGQGAASVNPSNGYNFTVTVPPTNVSISNSVGAAGSSTTGLNDININIPAPQFNPVTGALTTGTVVNNITPLVTFNSGVLTVGPSANNVTIPSTPATSLYVTGAGTINPSGPGYSLHVIPAGVAVTTNVAAAGVTSVAPNNFSINIPPPQYNAGTGVLSAGTATTDITQTLSLGGGILTVGPPSNTVIIPSTPATTLNATGAATINPSGPLYNLHVIPASIAITTNAAAAGATSVAPNSFSINIPPPQYNQNTGELVTGTSTANITQTLAMTGGVLTVGPSTNTVTIPSAPATSLSATGAATLNPSGPGYSLHVIPASIAITTNAAAAGATSVAPNSFSINIPPPQYNQNTGELVTGTSTANITQTLAMTGGVLTVGPSTNTVTIPSAPATSLSATGAATINPSGPGYSLHVIPASIAITTNAAAAGATSVAPNSFSINIPPPQYNQGTGELVTGTSTANITPTLAMTGGVLTVGPSTNTVTIPSAPATSLSATGAATINPSGPGYSLHVIPASIVITTNVAAAGATSLAPNSFSINIPPPQYNQGTGELVTGTSTANITQTLSMTNGVLTVGPSTNTVLIPSAPATSLAATGAATINPSGPGFSLHVIPASIAITTNVAAAGATSVAPNSFSINIPPPQYNPGTGILSAGTATTDITQTLAFGSGVLSVGPAGNTVSIPSTPATTLTATGAATLNPSGPGYSLHVIPTSIAVTTNVAAAGATSVAPNSFSINIPPPQYNPGTGVLSTGTATTDLTQALTFGSGVLSVGPAGNTVSIPSTPATTLTATGAATLNPSGPGYSLHVIPTSIAVTTNVAAAGATSVAPNSFSINIPPPQYNPGTGILTTGTATTDLTQALTFGSGVLSVGPSGNTVSIPSTPATTLTATGAATLNPSGPGYSLHVIPTSIAITTNVAAAGVTSVAPNDFSINIPPPQYDPATGKLTTGTSTTVITPTLSIVGNTLTVGPSSNSIAVSMPTITGQGLADVSPTSGMNFTVNVPVPSYNGTTGVMSSGTVNFNVVPVVNFTNNILTVGPGTNSTNLSAISPWTETGGTVALTTGTNHVGIGTSTPSGLLDIDVQSNDVSGINLRNTRDIVGSAIPVHISQTTSGQTFGTDTYGRIIRLTNQTINSAYDFGIDGSGSFFLANINSYSPPAFMINQSGQVGVNTSAPTSAFHVNGAVRITDGSQALNRVLTSDALGNATWKDVAPAWTTTGNVGTNFLTNYIGTNDNVGLAFRTNSVTRMAITNGGFVGVGTSTAGTQLEVNGDISIPSTAKFIFGTNGTGNDEWMENSSSGIGFFTSSLQRMQIENNGYVGIGTTGPMTRLELSGAENVTGLTVNGGSPGTTFRISNTDNSASNNFSSLSFATMASNGATYESSKIAAVHVNHTIGSQQGDIAFLTRTPGGITETMRITGLRRVGVNNTAPTATFQVNGTTRLVDGTEGAGKVLTSDASGNASWQSNGTSSGMVMAFAGPTANIPSGWVICDGTAISRTTYASLFAAIGTSWGIGDGSTTFNVPDMRGMFLRGVDGTAGNDPNAASRTAVNSGNSGNAVGSQQDDNFETHTHTITNHGNTNAALGLLGVTTGYVPGGTTTTNATGGSETRPKNVYVFYIVKL